MRPLHLVLSSDIVPPPDLQHADQELQLLKLHLHRFVLQVSWMFESPWHVSPPYFCPWQDRRRLLTPPPQVLEHKVHELQSPQTPSSGQLLVAQRISSSRLGHGAPIEFGLWMMFLSLIFLGLVDEELSVQVWLQELQVDHSLTKQSTLHS